MVNQFYLGTHDVSWLWSDLPADADYGPGELRWCVSYHRFRRYAARPRRTARWRWALDSGAYTELATHGRWTIPADEYVLDVLYHCVDIGELVWAGPQDWMCEPWIIHGDRHHGRTYPGTGLTLDEHLRRTVANFVELEQLWQQWRPYFRLAAGSPFVPSIQGWQADDYRRCIDLYEAAGVRLDRYPTVGVGSVCRRQHTGEIDAVFTALEPYGLNLHGFGVKTTGLTRYGHTLHSADSLAWSDQARRETWPDHRGHTRPRRFPDCPRSSCSNCLHYALDARRRLTTTLAARPAARQSDLLAELAAAAAGPRPARPPAAVVSHWSGRDTRVTIAHVTELAAGHVAVDLRHDVVGEPTEYRRIVGRPAEAAHAWYQTAEWAADEPERQQIAAADPRLTAFVADQLTGPAAPQVAA